jgi:hypothetical protein
MANIDGLYAIFKTSLEAQYDAYETEAKPKLRSVVLVRSCAATEWGLCNLCTPVDAECARMQCAAARVRTPNRWSNRVCASDQFGQNLKASV